MGVESSETLEELSDLYHRRRTVESGEPYEATICAVSWADEDTLRFILDVANEPWALTCTADTWWGDDGGLAELLRSATVHTAPTVRIDELVGTSLTVVFDGEMASCTPVEGTSSFDVQRLADGATDTGDDGFEVDESDQQSPSDFTPLERSLTLSRAYLDADCEWEVDIRDTVPEEGEQFTLVVDTGTAYDITWTFEVPKSTDSETDDVARLIEQVGGGELQFLDGGHVYAVAVEDVDQHLRTVGVDETGEWALSTPADFDEWEDAAQRAREEREQRERKRRRRHRRRSGSPPMRKLGVQMMMHGFALHLSLFFMNTFILEDMMATLAAEAGQTPDVVMMMTQMLGLLEVCGPLLVVGGGVMAILGAAQTS